MITLTILWIISKAKDGIGIFRRGLLNGRENFHVVLTPHQAMVTGPLHEQQQLINNQRKFITSSTGADVQLGECNSCHSRIMRDREDTGHTGHIIIHSTTTFTSSCFVLLNFLRAKSSVISHLIHNSCSWFLTMWYDPLQSLASTKEKAYVGVVICKW